MLEQVAAGRLVAMRRQQRHPLSRVPGHEVGQRVPGGRVGPLHVVDDQHRRGARDHPTQQGVDHGHQRRGALRGHGAQRGQDERRAGHRLDDRGPLGVSGLTQPPLQRQHQRVVHGLDRPEAQALAPQHLRSLERDLSAHAAHQRGLADPGLTVHQHRRRRAVQPGTGYVEQPRSLFRAAGQRRRHGSRSHATECDPGTPDCLPISGPRGSKGRPPGSEGLLPIRSQRPQHQRGAISNHSLRSTS